MAQPALRIYEMDIPRRDIPEETFHVTFYSPNENARLRGCLIVVHGCGENANRYRTMAKEALVPAGFTLVVPDLPGFGQTPGRPGVSSEEACLAVIDETVKLMASQTNGMPLFLYGHSMGGNLALNYLLKQEEQIAEDGTVTYVAKSDNLFHAAIISSPWLKLHRQIPDFGMKILRFIGGIMPSATTSARLKLERMCNDHKVLQDREQDKFCHNRISFKLLTDMWQSGQKALAEAPNLHLPLLLMYGSDDKVVSTEAMAELAANLPKHMHAARFDGFMHEIHNMQEREAVYETMLEFLALCLKRGNVPVVTPPLTSQGKSVLGAQDLAAETTATAYEADESELEQAADEYASEYDEEAYAESFEEPEAVSTSSVYVDLTERDNETAGEQAQDLSEVEVEATSVDEYAVKAVDVDTNADADADVVAEPPLKKPRAKRKTQTGSPKTAKK